VKREEGRRRVNELHELARRRKNEEEGRRRVNGLHELARRI
jgi:hypothetical protein